MPNAEGLKRGKVQKSGERSTLDLRNYFPYQLTFLTGSVSRALGSVMELKFGLNSAQWRIMAILGTFAPLSTFEIASRTSLEKSAVSVGSVLTPVELFAGVTLLTVGGPLSSNRAV